MDVVALVLSTIALVVWAFTLGIVGYGMWRYCYLPWLVMRKDIAALNEKIETYQERNNAEFGLRAARALSDEEEARFEAAQRREIVRQRLARG